MFKKGDVIKWRGDGACLRFLESSIKDVATDDLSYQELKFHLRFLTQFVNVKELKVFDVIDDISSIGFEGSDQTIQFLNPGSYFIDPDSPVRIE